MTVSTRALRYFFKTSAEARARPADLRNEFSGIHEECPGDEDDYDYQECCDSGCKYKGHWYKKATQN